MCVFMTPQCILWASNCGPHDRGLYIVIPWHLLLQSSKTKKHDVCTYVFTCWLLAESHIVTVQLHTWTFDNVFNWTFIFLESCWCLQSWLKLEKHLWAITWVPPETLWMITWVPSGGWWWCWGGLRCRGPWMASIKRTIALVTQLWAQGD